MKYVGLIKDSLVSKHLWSHFCVKTINKQNCSRHGIHIYHANIIRLTFIKGMKMYFQNLLETSVICIIGIIRTDAELGSFAGRDRGDRRG